VVDFARAFEQGAAPRRAQLFENPPASVEHPGIEDTSTGDKMRTARDLARVRELANRQEINQALPAITAGDAELRRLLGPG
jgi:hypothetical protein